MSVVTYRSLCRTWAIIAKDPQLARFAATWKRQANILDTRGVIPIVSKRGTMLAHIRRCPLVKQDQLKDLERELAEVENTPLGLVTPPISRTGSSASCYGGSPTKRARTHLGTQCGNSLGMDHDAAASELPSPTGAAAASKARFCEQCYEKNAARQEEFESDLCKLFIAANIPWYGAQNAELYLFVNKWVPGAKVPDRRKLSGELLDKETEEVVKKTRSMVKAKPATGVSDMWKNVARTDVLTSLMNVERKVQCAH